MARDRPFIPAGEQARPYSDILAERRDADPIERQRDRVLDEISELEAQACEAIDPAERKRLQCEAEGLRCGLQESRRT